jgi:hypothetical protein
MLNLRQEKKYRKWLRAYRAPRTFWGPCILVLGRHGLGSDVTKDRSRSWGALLFDSHAAGDAFV